MYPAVALGQSISYALQSRVPISSELTSNPVNSGPLMWIRGALGECISYALQCRVPISNELTSNPVNSELLMSGVSPAQSERALGSTRREY